MTLSVWPKIFRTHEWWHTKVPMVLGIFCFSFLENPLTVSSFTTGFIMLLLWASVTASFGFFLNEVFDYKQDLVSGKENFANAVGKRDKFVIAGILAFVSVSVWCWHPLGQLQMALSAVQLLLLCCNSIPPFRLKESGWSGILIDSLYAFVIPSIVAYIAAKITYQNLYANYTLFLLPGWTFLAGVRNILHRHIKDRKSDKISGAKNMANFYGVAFILRVCYSTLLLELAIFASYLYASPGNSLVKAVLITLYFLFNSFSANRYGLRFNLRRKIRSLRFNFNSLYEAWLLTAATVLLASADKRFWALLLIELLVFRNEAHYLVVSLLTSVYFKFLKPMPRFFRYRALDVIWYHGIGRLWYHGVLWVIWQVWRCGSLTVNYSIYYYRILVLKQPQNDARRAKPVLASQVKANNSAVPVNVEKKQARDIYEINCPNEISEDNLYINGLWIGSQLSKVELLTIESFLGQGHRFRLWTYDSIDTNLPHGVELMDANTIIDRSRIFRYKHFNKYGHGKGSVSGFSDIFRYKLLHDKGGWWVDMDVTCLKPLNFKTEYFFRSHHDLFLVGNIMKAPVGSRLMNICYEQAALEINENNTDWLRPIQILNENVLSMGLEDFVFKNFSNEDKWDEVAPLIRHGKKMPENYFLMHWMNEEWRSRGIDKNDVRFGSTFAKLLIKHELLAPPKTKLDEVKADLRHLFYIPVYEFFLNA